MDKKPLWALRPINFAKLKTFAQLLGLKIHDLELQIERKSGAGKPTTWYRRDKLINGVPLHLTLNMHQAGKVLLTDTCNDIMPACAYSLRYLLF
jgi:hypothetical protein